MGSSIGLVETVGVHIGESRVSLGSRCIEITME